jgi:ATP-dependent DNA ligase
LRLLVALGYRAIAFKTGGTLHLRSRNDNDFSLRYPSVIEGLAKLPNETVVDGEIVAFDEVGRPSFNALQNYGSSGDEPLETRAAELRLVLESKGWTVPQMSAKGQTHE